MHSEDDFFTFELEEAGTYSYTCAVIHEGYAGPDLLSESFRSPEVTIRVVDDVGECIVL